MHRDILAAPLQRVALAYLTKTRQDGKLYDPVATFHLSNGARLERINAFGNLRPYGLKASFGVTANYRYIPAELEENHERFVRGRFESQIAYSKRTRRWKRRGKRPGASFNPTGARDASTNDGSASPILPVKE